MCAALVESANLIARSMKLLMDSVRIFDFHHVSLFDLVISWIPPGPLRCIAQNPRILAT